MADGGKPVRTAAVAAQFLKGQATLLQTGDEIAEAERAQLLPWIATRKRHFVRIIPTEISGRRFRFGTEPDEDFSYAT